MRGVPNGWTSATIADIATLFRGVSYKKGQSFGVPGAHRLPILRANNIDKGLCFNDLVYVEEGLVSDEQKVREGDIVLAMSSGSKRMVGKSALVTHSFDGAFGAFCGLLRPHKVISSRFISYLLSSRPFRRHVETQALGTNINNLKREHVLEYEVALPPFTEQHRIVARIEELFSGLDKGIEALITARELVHLYRLAILKAAFDGTLTKLWRDSSKETLETAQKVLARIRTERESHYEAQLEAWRLAVKEWELKKRSGLKPKKPLQPKRLPSISDADLTELGALPRGWSWIRIGEIAGVGTGVTPLKSNVRYHTNGTVPWVTSGALNESFVRGASAMVTVTAYNETNLRLYQPNTLLVALYGEGKTRGKCSELLIESTTNQAIAAIVLEGEAAELRSLLKWFLTKNYELIRIDSSGGVQPNLNLGVIENMPVPMCSPTEARRLAELLTVSFSLIDQCDAEISCQVERCERLRQSILMKAFAGQLVAQDPNDEPASVLLERIRVGNQQVEKQKKDGRKKRRQQEAA